MCLDLDLGILLNARSGKEASLHPLNVMWVYLVEMIMSLESKMDISKSVIILGFKTLTFDVCFVQADP